jgi:restriction system protein
MTESSKTPVESAEMLNDPRMFGAELDDPQYHSGDLVGRKYPRPKLSPREFELAVKRTLDAESSTVADYQSSHREVLDGSDGSYEIDIVIRFGFGDLSYLTLVECKAYGSPVKRDKVAELWAKLQSTGAHKGVLFSTSGFQSGALKFALKHGIALVHVADKWTSVLAKANIGLAQSVVAATRLEEVCCWLVQGTMISILWDESSPTVFTPTNAGSSPSGSP